MSSTLPHDSDMFGSAMVLANSLQIAARPGFLMVAKFFQLNLPLLGLLAVSLAVERLLQSLAESASSMEAP
jgi:hypothetical protein